VISNTVGVPADFQERVSPRTNFWLKAGIVLLGREVFFPWAIFLKLGGVSLVLVAI